MTPGPRAKGSLLLASVQRTYNSTEDVLVSGLLLIVACFLRGEWRSVLGFEDQADVGWYVLTRTRHGGNSMSLSHPDSQLHIFDKVRSELTSMRSTPRSDRLQW